MTILRMLPNSIQIN